MPLIQLYAATNVRLVLLYHMFFYHNYVNLDENSRFLLENKLFWNNHLLMENNGQKFKHNNWNKPNCDVL